jgi:hypothetical protein
MGIRSLLPYLWIFGLLGFGVYTWRAVEGWGGSDLDGSTLTPSGPAHVLGLAHAIHLRPTLNYGQEILNFSNLVGKRPAVVMYFMDWQGNPNASGLERYFDPYLLNTISNTLPVSARPAVMLTWQPLFGRQATGCAQDYPGAIPLPDILNGKCDPYIRGFAQALKARPVRFLLRFAHEMNISDSPWWVGHIGADPSLYVAVWRHVHRIFKQVGVSNVEWVWSPNYASNPPDPWNDLHAYYPGDDVVDWIGLSGYNWYATRSPVIWRTFTDLYDAVLKDLACSYPKPQIIAEIGSVEGDGATFSKAAWIRDAYSRAPSYPFLRVVQWFNDYAYADPRSADFRVTTSTAQDGSVQPLPHSSGAWTSAYRDAIGNPVYTTTLPALSAATPPARFCGGDPFALAPAFLLLPPTGEAVVSITGIGFTVPLTLAPMLPSGISGTLQGGVWNPPWAASSLRIQTTNTPLGFYTGSVRIQGPGLSRTLPISIQVVSRVYPIWIPMVRR